MHGFVPEGSCQLSTTRGFHCFIHLLRIYQEYACTVVTAYSSGLALAASHVIGGLGVGVEVVLPHDG